MPTAIREPYLSTAAATKAGAPTAAEPIIITVYAHGVGGLQIGHAAKAAAKLDFHAGYAA
jgi:hypothetical protein